MPAFGKRRALGQHFLRDANIASRIADTAVELAVRTGCKTLLEVGPGKGAITEPILDRLQGRDIELILAERDRQLAADWKTRVHKLERVQVEEGDFLDLPEERWLHRSPVGVASNLPYSAGTAICTRLASHPEKIPFMVLMFQAEVAQRLRAEPDSKSWGSLSVWIQNRWDVEKLCAVPPGAFAPPPDVQSEVVVLRRREVPRILVPDERLWERLLKGCFAHRRKMLRAGLRGDPLLRNALEASGVDGTKRAESLDWKEWEALFRAALEASREA